MKNNFSFAKNSIAVMEYTLNYLICFSDNINIKLKTSME